MAAPFPSPTSTWHSDTYPAISPTRPELSAKHKTVVVTGGGTGIGAETARRFAQAGASQIAILGRREQRLLDTKASIERELPDVEVTAIRADITNKNEVDAAFAKIAGDFGTIHVLVNSAAVTGPHDPVESVDSHEFLEAIQQNLKGALFVAQAFLRHAAQDAVAIEINSYAAHLNSGPGFASYSTAKVAVYRLWDCLAFANPDMSVFHIQPGVVDTEMNREAGGVKAVGFEDNVALPACFNVWLASPEARFLKGKFLWTNWDVEELMSQREALEASTQLNITLGGWPFNSAGWKASWSM